MQERSRKHFGLGPTFPDAASSTQRYCSTRSLQAQEYQPIVASPSSTPVSAAFDSMLCHLHYGARASLDNN